MNDEALKLLKRSIQSASALLFFQVVGLSARPLTHSLPTDPSLFKHPLIDSSEKTAEHGMGYDLMYTYARTVASSSFWIDGQAWWLNAGLNQLTACP